MTQADYDIWQEYERMRQQEQKSQTPTAYDVWQSQAAKTAEDWEREEEDQRFKNSDFAAPPTELELYERRISEIAAANCKTRKEWQDEEAEDMRPLATGVMTQKSAGELLERYQTKIQGIYRTEKWYEKQVVECDLRIAELEKETENLAQTNRKRALTGARNKLKHWRARRAGLQRDAMRHLGKERRLEKKNMKWRGVMEKIKEADTARAIRDERRGIGNKYGFNPKAKSRATAEIMFHD